MKKKAIYPGTFDPITKGHKDIIIRASRIFDELIVAISTRKGKNPLFSLKERMRMARLTCRGLDNVKVCEFKGLLVHFAQRMGVSTIIRGLRAISDFEYEFQMALMNHQMNQEIENIFFMSNLETSFLSSSLLKEIALSGGDISAFVPQEILAIIEKRITLITHE